jgi:hypothetical protein
MIVGTQGEVASKATLMTLGLINGHQLSMELKGL